MTSYINVCEDCTSCTDCGRRYCRIEDASCPDCPVAQEVPC